MSLLYISKFGKYIFLHSEGHLNLVQYWAR